MTPLADSIVLGPEEEAARLWKGALEAYSKAADSLVALCESLDLGIRSAEILAIRRLQPVKGDFPATIALLLETPDAEVDVARDAISMERSLQFADVLDLLSDGELECVSPSLHRGWEDRRFACRRSRRTAQAAAGVTLAARDREQLLLLAAYRNRIFRTPPPVRIEPNRVLLAFASLERLVGELG